MEDSGNAPVNINSMPAEIILHIFHFLDGAPPSELRLHDQPSDTLLDEEPELQCLKAASLVCKAWRSLVLPKLFRHVLWRPQVSSLSSFTLNPTPLLRFLEDNKLDHNVHTFTLLVDFVDEWADAHRRTPHIRSVDLEWFWDQLFCVVDPLRFTIIAPPTILAAIMSRMLCLEDAWSFDMPYHILSLSRKKREGLPVPGSRVDGPLSDVKLSAAKSDRSGEATRPVGAATAAGSSPSPTSASRSRRSAPPCPLFTVRPWTALLLNEGSSTKVYRTYEFFLRRPPSMLGALLGCEEYPNDAPMVPRSVVDFSYVAIFPLSEHFDLLPSYLPRIDRLFVQLMPRPGGSGSGGGCRCSVLDDPDEMRHINLADLWTERDVAYDSLAREMALSSLERPRREGTGADNWAMLRVFECGDAVDREAWGVVRFYYEKTGDSSWKIQRNGLFVRCGERGEEQVAMHDHESKH